MVAMMMSVLQYIDFLLHITFGQSVITYGRTSDDPTMRLAQSNGAALPGFLSISMLMVGAYKRLGHGIIV